ncbi:MAG: tail fiber protein [Methylocystaceae bacterium]|nr:tail fiber protein [Methylocystaceae bacterium]
MAVVSPTAKAQFIDAAGIPLAGGFLYTYVAGTTTPQATYTDAAASTPNSNPIVLDSRGEANIWLTGSSYKFKLTDANGTEIWTVDNIAPPSTAVSPVFTTNVTIADNSPGPALLITQLGAGPAIRVQDETDPDSSPFVVDSTGNVGIGIASPANKLDVAGGAIQISTSGGTARTVISADATDSIFEASSTRNFTIKTNSATRLTINATDATSTVPVVLPADPTTALQAATKQYVDAAGPAGAIMAFAGTSVPSGWLACQGQAVSQTTYAALYAAIGATWNTGGEGAGNFRLPDLRGMFLRGTGTNGTGSSSGAAGPSVGAYAADTYLNHSHGITDPGHTHTIPFSNFFAINNGTSRNYADASSTTNTSTATTGVTVNTSTTGGTETKPKNYGVLYIIKT